MSFIRRFGYFPGAEQLTQIEGVAIIDLPPPGSVQGVNTGVVGVIGEFSDMTYAVSVDTSGAVTSNVQPQEVFGSQDLLSKFGGFDEALGEFGVSGGNGFVALRNKLFSRLIVAAVNLASAYGMRIYRDLPMCTSQLNANPIVPMSGATVSAGREFRSGVGRVRLGARVVFTAIDPITKGISGDTIAGASAATQVFNADTGFDWTTIERGDGTLGARKGDILVIGYNNGGVIAPAGEGGTYRVAADPSSGVAITIERLDGANFTFTGTTDVPWRLHFASDADSAPVIVPGATSPGGYGAGDAGGYTVPARPITSPTGTQVDGNYTAGTLLTPYIVPDATTGDSWDPFSGLGARIHVTNAVPFTAAVQGINPVASASIDALYSTAIDAFLADDNPIRDTSIMYAARTSNTIRTKMRSHVLLASQRGRGRRACISPPLTTVTTTSAVADSAPGVGAYRAERVVYNWPGLRTYIPEAVGFRLKTADGLTTTDGILDTMSDAWAAAIMSNLPPERNPGQAQAPVPTIMSPVLGIQRGVASLQLGDYIALKAAGIMGPKIDRTSGPIFQSGITTSLTSGEKNILRRRMADFMQDSLAERLVQFSKLPLTQQVKDGVSTEVEGFMLQLLSPGNPAAQRINAYNVDDRSANNDDLEAQGIYIVIVQCRLTPTGDVIGIQTEIGENVVIRQVA